MGRVIESTPEAEDKITTSVSLDGKHTLEYIEGPKTHRYKLDGKRVPGVSTVSGFYPKGEGLIKWMVQRGIEEFTNKTALKRGGDIGTVLHNFAECHETGKVFDERTITASPYEVEIRRAIAQFMEWRSKNADEIVEAESIVASIDLLCGGKIDTLRRRPNVGLVLSDYKTSKDIYVTQLIQVIGGYRRMYREWKGLNIPFVEIVTFPKEVEHTQHTLLADNSGWTKDGVRVDVPNFFQKMEDQFVRNFGGYRFKQEIEDKLNPYVPVSKAGN